MEEKIVLQFLKRHSMNYTLYSDGGARGNPGPAAIGYVLYDEQGKIIAEQGDYIGIATNNQAEYKALLAALEHCKEIFKATHVNLVCFLDSELIVRQLNRQYKVKNQGIQELFKKVTQLLAYFTRIEFRHIPREQNERADYLVNKVLDLLEK